MFQSGQEVRKVVFPDLLVLGSGWIGRAIGEDRYGRAGIERSSAQASEEMSVEMKDAG